MSQRESQRTVTSSQSGRSPLTVWDMDEEIEWTAYLALYISVVRAKRMLTRKRGMSSLVRKQK